MKRPTLCRIVGLVFNRRTLQHITKFFYPYSVDIATQWDLEKVKHSLQSRMCCYHSGTTTTIHLWYNRAPTQLKDYLMQRAKPEEVHRVIYGECNVAHLNKYLIMHRPRRFLNDQSGTHYFDLRDSTSRKLLIEFGHLLPAVVLVSEMLWVVS